MEQISLIFESELNDKYYECIKNGSKKYECRLNDEKRRRINVGDIWIFNKTLKVKVVEKKIYQNFEDAVLNTSLSELLPDVTTKLEAIQIYHRFEGYKAGASKYGVVVFKIELC